jgi:glycosyltransferase involved in cell wall biosynthesis
MNIQPLNTTNPKKRLKIFTWHIHGSYLYYLTQTDCEFYIPKKNDKTPGYGGRAGSFAWGTNVHEVPYEKVKDLDLDVIIFQSKDNYLKDQYEILSKKQQQLPRIYIEHDPPRENPTNTKHVVDDPDVLLVHVTHFNKLMWDNNRTPSIVIDHGVMVAKGISYSGDIPKGIVVINGLQTRGRRLGLDIFEKVRKEVPLDLIGMESEKLGGLGEVPHDELPAFISRYRFFCSPIRYTSLGLSLLESMMLGQPLVGLATTELPTVILNDFNGYIETDVNFLIEKMKLLISNQAKAKELGDAARLTAQRRFSINRFAHDWEQVFTFLTQQNASGVLQWQQAQSDKVVLQDFLQK